MGKRVVAAPGKHHVSPPVTRNIRKRKRKSAATEKNMRLSGNNSAAPTGAHQNGNWHENDDEDSSSNDALPAPARNQSSKHANNSSILLNSSLNLDQAGGDCNSATIESPKPVYTLRPSIVNGTILYDLTKKPWHLGRPIGKGNFGEIFLASDNITIPVTNENAKFVVKIEPHSNGPLFVEIHCLINTAKKSFGSNVNTEQHDSKSFSQLPNTPPSGIPKYIASGSHYFGNARYRFLVLQRFDRDLHSLIKNCRVHQKSVLTLAIQILNVLENLHDKGYCHNDVKAQNLMISKCKYTKQLQKAANGNGKSAVSVAHYHKKHYDDNYEEKQPTTDSGNSSDQEANDDDDNMDDADFVVKRKQYAHDDDDDDEDDDDEDFDDLATTNSNSMDIYHTPVNRNRKGTARKVVEFSGSNPVRSCRRQKRTSIYEEMVKSHYLRPTKRISYSEFFNEDGVSMHGDDRCPNSSSTDESEEFVPRRACRSTKKTSSTAASAAAKRLTRHQEKLSNQQQLHSCRQSTTAAEWITIEEDRIFLIDFGLASKFMDNGVHRPFVMDQRRAHDGTLEFTSRDAHMGAHSRRSDLECLGYNLLFWSQGYLPWKDAALQHQQEKVHQAKEYLMTDVRELLKQIYGKLVPKYLGEFLHQVGQLAYHERPDYERYCRLFMREFQQLGYDSNEMQLDSQEIVRSCVRIKDELENKTDIFELGKPHQSAVWNIMNNMSVSTPFQERSSNRVSPKNLRSKSDKKSMKKKKFSWAEILSQDPDQIARARAEKEFDREDELSEVQQTTVRRYEGKPTYAILEIQHRLKMNGSLEDDEEEEVIEDENKAEEEDEVEEEDASDIEYEQEDEDVEMTAETTEEEEEEDEQSEDEVETEEEEEIETDATEASSEQLKIANGRNRRVRKVNSRTNTSSSRKGSLRDNNGRYKSNQNLNSAHGGKSVSTKKLKTRKHNNSKSASGAQGKRASATRCARKTGAGVHVAAASAAGESTRDHITALRNVENRQRNGAAVYERRTRRCLIKTDAGEVKGAEDEESNSNFSPDREQRGYSSSKKL